MNLICDLLKLPNHCTIDRDGLCGNNIAQIFCRNRSFRSSSIIEDIIKEEEHHADDLACMRETMGES